MYMRQYAWRIIRISKEILQIFSHYFAESATRRRLPQAISKTCGDAPTRRRKKRLRKMEVGLARARNARRLAGAKRMCSRCRDSERDRRRVAAQHHQQHQPPDRDLDVQPAN